MYASFNVLRDPVFFTESIKTESVLPAISNFEGRSYELKLDANGILTLVVEDVELVVLKGDVNGDKLIDILDLVILSRYLAELQTLEGKSLLAADVNSDGFIDILDLVKISRILAELE